MRLEVLTEGGNFIMEEKAKGKTAKAKSDKNEKILRWQRLKNYQIEAKKMDL